MLKPWYVYIIRCVDNTLYTGITTDIQRRLHEHTTQVKGAKYLRGRLPIKLELLLEVENRSIASKLENKIKQLSRSNKELIINNPDTLDIYC